MTAPPPSTTAKGLVSPTISAANTATRASGGTQPPSAGPGGELRTPRGAAWEPSHYAAAAIEALVASLAAYATERYGR